LQLAIIKKYSFYCKKLSLKKAIFLFSKVGKTRINMRKATFALNNYKEWNK